MNNALNYNTPQSNQLILDYLHRVGPTGFSECISSEFAEDESADKIERKEGLSDTQYIMYAVLCSSKESGFI